MARSVLHPVQTHATSTDWTLISSLACSWGCRSVPVQVVEWVGDVHKVHVRDECVVPKLQECLQQGILDG
jgi:hypothetical protein